MNDMQQIEFQVGAKAARLLGRENIADVDGALIELIKNAYDADASCVYVEFYIPFPDVPEEALFFDFSKCLSVEEMECVLKCYDHVGEKLKKKQDLPEQIQEQLKSILFSHNRIIIADNGTGMTWDIVKSAWMYIGTSDKEHNFQSKKGRIKTGAKGIGRLALDKLSVKSVMYTKTFFGEETIKWSMDWNQFVNAELIGDVKAELDVRKTGYLDIVREMSGKNLDIFDEHDWSSGTLFVLNPLREAWSERLFRKVNTNLKSINPIGSADRFEVRVKNAFYSEYDFRTEKVAIDKEDYDYRICMEYDGDSALYIRLLRNEVDLTKKTVTIERYGNSKRKSLDEFWAREKFQKEDYRGEDYDKEILRVKNVTDVLPKDSLEKIQKVGPFSAEMYFLRNAPNAYGVMKPVSVRKRKKLLEQFSGIKIYRDDFKVRPYGDEGAAMYDWIGMSSRVQKSPAAVSHKLGAWRVQPYQMIGLVKIGRKSNPYLEDMANREGIALTDTYYIFVNLIQECLKEFEFDRQYIYREYARWVESVESEISDYVKRVQEEAVRRAQESKKDRGTEKQDKTEKDTAEETEKDGQISEEEMLNTVYQMMQDSERELNSKQILQVLSSSGILINTFFHEFNAINTQFHVQAPQIRSRVNYILKGKEYEGIPAYNPYNRIDILEENDKLTAAFLDVIMDGLRKDNLKEKYVSLKEMISDIITKWEILLKRKHIAVEPVLVEDESIDDYISIAIVDMYIILNNFILNSAWFLEQGHNEDRKILFTIKKQDNTIHLLMEDNGPGLAEKFRDNPDKIFEIGETSKGEKGTGLGLWVVKETVERYDGIISVMDKAKGFGLEIIWKNRNGGADV